MARQDPISVKYTPDDFLVVPFHFKGLLSEWSGPSSSDAEKYRIPIFGPLDRKQVVNGLNVRWEDPGAAGCTAQLVAVLDGSPIDTPSTAGYIVISDLEDISSDATLSTAFAFSIPGRSDESTDNIVPVGAVICLEIGGTSTGLADMIGFIRTTSRIA